MKTRFAIAVSGLLLWTVSAFAGTVFLDDSLGNLYAGDPTTGTYSLVGNSGISGGFADISFTSDGNLWGLDSSGNLYNINPYTAAASLVGATNITDGSLTGLAGDSAGNLVAGGNGLIDNINTGTPGSSAVIGTSGQAYTTAGDLEFVNGTLYLTSTTGTVANGGELWSVNTSSGVGSDIGNTGFAAVWGLAFDTDNNIFYGYTSGGTQISIDTGSGAGTSLFASLGGDASAINGTTDKLLGAAFVAPEPSTFFLIGSALTLLAASRRRKV